jgi:threonine dehydrogenase-like Zn-dependent dehydrogenase
MKTAVLTKEGFEIREVPKPECKADEVLVKTSACGICEGDVFQYKTIGDEEKQLGHEGGGVVCEVGANVRGFEVGETVTALGGPYSEYFSAKPETLVKLPSNMVLESALGEPIACFVHAAGRFGVKPGDRVALIGCGFMGMGCLQMAKIQGAEEIIAIEPIKWRRDTAVELGATSTVDPSGKTAEDILAELNEFDVVIEAAGIPAAVDICTALVKQHGKIILVGYHQSNNGMRNVDMKTWNFKAIDVINGHVRRNDEKYDAMAYGMELVESGKLNIKPMVSSYAFDDIALAFKDLVDRKEGLYKAVLTQR